MTCGNSDKVNPSGEINPKVNSNNSYSNDAMDFVMVQPEQENPTEKPLPSLPPGSTKVRFLLPVTKEPSDTSVEPPIPQVLPTTRHVPPQVLPATKHVTQQPQVLPAANPSSQVRAASAHVTQGPPIALNQVTPPIVSNQVVTPPNAPQKVTRASYDPPIDEGWIQVSGRKSTQKPKTSNYWINGTSSKSTQKLHTANAHVEHGTSKVPGSLGENVVFST